MRPLAVCLLSAALASAGAPRVTLRADRETAVRIAQEIQRQTGIRLVLPEEIGPRRVSLHFADEVPQRALERFAHAVGGALVELEGRAYRIAPVALGAREAWQRDLMQVLETSTVKRARFHNQTLEQVVNQLPQQQNPQRWIFLLDDGIDVRARVRVDVENISLKDLVTLMVKQAGYAWDLRYGAVFISSRDRLATLPRALTLDAPDLEARTVMLHFNRQNVFSMVQWFSQQNGFDVRVAPGCEQQAMRAYSRLQLRQVSARLGLEAILVPAGFTAERRGGTILVRPR